MELVTNWKKVVLENYANFSGRARRREYWLFALANVIVVIVLAILSAVSNLFFVLLVLYYVAVIVPTLAVAVRRLHDVGMSGWFILISLVPFVGGLILLWFTVQDSQNFANQYGPSPKYG